MRNGEFGNYPAEKKRMAVAVIFQEGGIFLTKGTPQL
jgi:hypothetical protein